MARYEHLPIYKTAMDLAVYLEQVVRNFSRYHKYTLGSDLRQQSRELVTVILRANSRREKVPVLYELRERLEGLLVLLRIGQEVRAFQKFTAYGQAGERAELHHGASVPP
jgi:23S rRNA-intervening sequence protein